MLCKIITDRNAVSRDSFVGNSCLLCIPVIGDTITGGDGNKEYLSCFVKNGEAVDYETIKRIVR